jgi:ribosomal protein L31E
LIVKVVVPFLRKHASADKIRAVRLALAIYEQSLNTSQGRMNLILRKFRAAASKSMETSEGEGTVPSATDYFGCRDQRREAMLVFHGNCSQILLMQNHRLVSLRSKVASLFVHFPTELVGFDYVLQTTCSG